MLRLSCLRVVLSVALLLVTLLVIASQATAAVFAPTPDEAKTAQALTPNSALSPQDKSTLFSTVPLGQDFYQIDDMLFPIRDIQTFDAFSGNRWTNGVVYYAFQPDVSAANRQRFADAAHEWAIAADLTFVQRTNQANYILVNNCAGNSSFVGMIGGAQNLCMFNWTFKYIIVHEIGHALGLSHEQSRSDRDDFVNIFLENVVVGAEINFNKSATVSFGGYDFDSVMHYRRNTFSSNGLNTVEPKPAFAQFLNTMGQRTSLSNADKAGMAGRYGAKLADTFEADNASGNAGVFTLGSTQEHSIFPTADNDWVRFTLTEKSRVFIQTAGSFGDTVLTLYNSALTQLAINDDINSGNFFSAINGELLDAGVYFIKVEEFGNNAPIANYTLSVNAQAESDDDDFLLLLIPSIVSGANQR